jgi:uncharacterized glyoxalase superfamily protein PhnB
MSLVNPLREGFPTATPYGIVSHGKAAVEFCGKVFDAEVTEMLRNLAGRLAHAAFRTGTSMIMLGEHPGDYAIREGAFPAVSIYLYVPDADAAFARAVDAGAKVVMPVSDRFYGNRDGGAEYPAGVIWWIASRVEELTAEQLKPRHAEEMMRRAAQAAAQSQ